MALTNRELTDLQFKLHEVQAAAAGQEAGMRGQVELLLATNQVGQPACLPAHPGNVHYVPTSLL